MDGRVKGRYILFYCFFSLPFYCISLIISYEKCMVYVMDAGRLFALIVFFFFIPPSPFPLIRWLLIT